MPEKESEFIGNLMGAKLLICRKVIWLANWHPIPIILFLIQKNEKLFILFKIILS
jgi:hypothetical protein